MANDNGEFRELVEGLREIGGLSFRKVVNPDAETASKVERVRRMYHEVYSGRDFDRRTRFIRYLNGDGSHRMSQGERDALERDRELIYRGVSYVQDSQQDLELAG